MNVVTAASSAYFGGLANLVGSLHYWSPATQIIIYDIGLDARLHEEISRWRNVRMVEAFLSRDWPEHCHELKMYAWKPLVIRDALQQCDSVLWIDAGSDLRAPPGPIQGLLQSDGHFFVQGQDHDMTAMSHAGCYQALDTDIGEFHGRPHFAGNVQGYVRGGDAARLVLEPMVACALSRHCIAPEGSNLQNHRYDQTVLSVILYRCGLDVTPMTALLAAERTQLNDDPRQASDRIVYTARNSSREYLGQLRDRAGGYCYPQRAPA